MAEQVEQKEIMVGGTETLIGDERRMSSREIAKLVEKRHKHVIRDIEEMLKKIGNDNCVEPKSGPVTSTTCTKKENEDDNCVGLKSEPVTTVTRTQDDVENDKYNRPKFEAVTNLAVESRYQDSRGENRKEYLLNQEATYTLVTGYDVVRRHRVVKRWMDLESGKAAPKASIETLMSDYINLSEALEYQGLSRKKAQLKADSLIEKRYGFSYLRDVIDCPEKNIGKRKFIAGPTVYMEKYHDAKDLASMMGMPLEEFNVLLLEMGEQVIQGYEKQDLFYGVNKKDALFHYRYTGKRGGGKQIIVWEKGIMKRIADYKHKRMMGKLDYKDLRPTEAELLAG